MTKMIFVNLPVGNVLQSTAFYEALGFEKNDAFSNEQASAMVWSDAISVMLLDYAFYATFTDKPIADTRATSAVLNCLSFDDKRAVDAFHAAAKNSGGSEPRAIKDQGFLYGGAIEDPDGHTWETMWMDKDWAPPAAD
ncbi:hypothetical protein E3U23_02580 [Erythrobacter litoralis]|uniref:VOC family protein n=1 Tax=Erythrobacter litoralis TaxID=39960 RepID=UPI002434EABE|nr:VOC family protein [Erythrobacter litoralis]MDG6078081.1 hypothetical protein [Erythrobacter litoralis]